VIKVTFGVTFWSSLIIDEAKEAYVLMKVNKQLCLGRL